MIPIFTLIMYYIVHWYADFVLQTHEQATKKSKSNKYLLLHTLTYSSVWFVFIFGYYVSLGFMKALLLALSFSLTTLFFHTITDYVTSRITARYWTSIEKLKELLRHGMSKLLSNNLNKTIHRFFNIIGFDQCLHYIQLSLTYLLLQKIIEQWTV